MTSTTPSLEADWDTFCAIENEVAKAESGGIEARWRCGKMLLRYEKGGGRSGSPLANAIRILTSEFGLGKTEFYNRRLFAEVYATGDEVSYALETFGSWHEIVRRGLNRRGQRVTPPLPDTEFRCITIDPPWPIEKIVREVRPAQGPAIDYPTLTIEEIDALVGQVLSRQEGCHVYLWTTHRFLPVSFELFKSWGVKYECLMTWVKNVGPTPFSWMYDTEHVLFGRKGRLDLAQNGLRLSFSSPATGHSIKPAVFYERVEAASPGPRLAMFERTERPGFEVWGDEVAA